VIDGYSRQARIVPVLIAALPLVLLGVVALPRLAAIDRVVTLVLLAALLPLFDQFGRARGRRCEPALFDAWGGRPTTQLLRWRGPATPSLQAHRHQALERVTGERLPTPDEEDRDPVGADEAYDAAVRTLRTLAADNLVVLAENRSYGFRRNLFGLRAWGYLATAASFAVMAVWAGLSYPVVTQLPVLGALAGVDLALLAMWLAVVREPWVREAAWIYAERLLDQVERLDAQRESGTARLSVTRPASGPVEAMRSPVPPTVAVLTALACELAAVTAVLRQARPIVDGPAGDPNHYLAGELLSRDPAVIHHVVTTVLPHDGNRSAAVVATDVLRSFPTIRCVIFSGIAGGVPDPQHPGEGVRLGDVLVAVDGIVDYDHTSIVDGEERPRRHLQGLSAEMLRAVQELRATHLDPGVPLKRELDRVTDPRFARPEAQAANRGPGMPRVHFGAIGSAEHLLRDAERRDQLARRYGIKGVEMEASGLAVGASLHGVPWFVVRGVADYCDNLKNEVWHDYASLTSAAFVAVLLRHCRPLGADHPAAAPPP
jgi:nucleoside phosphorylase